jgi:serine/threonine protein kinase
LGAEGVDNEVVSLEPDAVVIPGYELFEIIGEGGMGRVYRARQLSLGRTVAVKVLKTEVQQAAPDVAFQRESQLMASLLHPNLVTVYDCGQAAGHYYLVTELVAAPTLRSQMRPGQPWPVARAAEVLDRIAQAISYIHQHGVLHLDLKPENILYTSEGQVKITDFGLARALVDAGALSELGLARGTLEYCPPEQRFGLPTDERSDLFSLAVLAYELLTGQLPGRVYESARALNPQLPAKLDEVLRRALARNPEERPASVAAFRSELLSALRPGPHPYRRLAGMVGALLLAWACLLLGYYSRGQQKNVQPTASPPGPIQAWLLYDQPKQLTELEKGLRGEGLPVPSPLLVCGRSPNKGSGLDLPAWPTPWPVLVVHSEKATGFIHLLNDPALGRQLLGQWGALVNLSPTPPDSNLIRVGGFEGKCLAPDSINDSFAWRLVNSRVGPDAVKLAAPPGQPDNQALLLTAGAAEAGEAIGCYQWLARVPQQPGTVLVLRYRACAAKEGGRLTVRVRQPLLVPKADKSKATAQLLEQSVPFAQLPHEQPGQEGRLYLLNDWVRPGAAWRSYYTLWEWPAYCTSTCERNLEVVFVGPGAVWVDDLELFTWEMGVKQ